MAELQALHWQQAECMETRAKSFVADGAKCHHLGHGFTQRWANMDGALGCQDHHRPLPPPPARFLAELIPASHGAVVCPALLEVLHKTVQC